MGSAIPGGVDRRTSTNEKLGALVTSRNETLSQLAELARRQPFHADASMERALRRFCEALIDYTASAHFQLYRFLADKRERRQAVLAVADEVYPKIVETTDTILRFNDKYESMSLDNSVEFLAIEHFNSFLGLFVGFKLDETEVRLLTTIAASMGSALENARLFNETHELLERQTATAEVLGAISSSVVDTAPVFDKILDSCHRLFAADERAVLLVDDAGQLRIGQYQGPSRHIVEQTLPAPVEKTPWATSLEIWQRARR